MITTVKTKIIINSFIALLCCMTFPLKASEKGMPDLAACSKEDLFNEIKNVIITRNVDAVKKNDK